MSLQRGYALWTKKEWNACTKRLIVYVIWSYYSYLLILITWLKIILLYQMNRKKTWLGANCVTTICFQDVVRRKATEFLYVKHIWRAQPNHKQLSLAKDSKSKTLRTWVSDNDMRRDKHHVCARWHSNLSLRSQWFRQQPKVPYTD